MLKVSLISMATLNLLEKENLHLRAVLLLLEGLLDLLPLWQIEATSKVLLCSLRQPGKRCTVSQSQRLKESFILAKEQHTRREESVFLVKNS